MRLKAVSIISLRCTWRQFAPVGILLLSCMIAANCSDQNKKLSRGWTLSSGESAAHTTISERQSRWRWGTNVTYNDETTAGLMHFSNIYIHFNDLSVTSVNENHLLECSEPPIFKPKDIPANTNCHSPFPPGWWGGFFLHKSLFQICLFLSVSEFLEASYTAAKTMQSTVLGNIVFGAMPWWNNEFDAGAREGDFLPRVDSLRSALAFCGHQWCSSPDSWMLTASVWEIRVLIDHKGEVGTDWMK